MPTTPEPGQWIYITRDIIWARNHPNTIDYSLYFPLKVLRVTSSYIWCITPGVSITDSVKEKVEQSHPSLVECIGKSLPEVSVDRKNTEWKVIGVDTNE